MTRTLDEFLNEERQKNERVDNLSIAIAADKKELKQVREDYETAVIADNDKDTNRLFKEIERLESKIKADEHKLTTLKSVTDKHIREAAITTLQTFHLEVRDKHKAKAAEALETIEQAKQKYIESLHVLEGLNEAYNAERQEYKPLLNRYSIDGREINQRNHLFNDIYDYGTVAPDKTNMVITTNDIAEGLK